MQQVLHLLILDRDREAALSSCHATRWLLPVLTCSERRRAAPAAVAWAAAQGICCNVAGQWLGRVAADATDWLIVAVAASSRLRQSALQWTPLSVLSPLGAMLDYQGWAIAATLQGSSLPSVPGPFGNVSWPDEVAQWIRASAGAPVLTMTPYRVAPHEIVIGAETARRRVYFKGLADERAGEVRLTRLLAETAPGSFPRTIAAEERPNGCTWWLAAECRGKTGADVRRIAPALARVQRRVMASAPVIGELPAVQLDEAVRWAAGFAGDESCAAAIARAADRAAGAHLPQTWIPLDLHPTNVVVGEGANVYFIDLDESYLGPAPLAMAALARWGRDPSIYPAYEESWSPALTGVDWPAFEAMSATLATWRGWLRFERCARRGEVHGALDVVASRIRERLASVAYRR
jgi:hypothetical protein